MTTPYRVEVTATTSTGAAIWALTASGPTEATPDPADHWYLLDGATWAWAITEIPPVAVPATCQFQIYDDGAHADGWLPIARGQSIRVNLFATHPGDTEKLLASLDGRISEATAANHSRGGVVYSVVATDTLGALLGGDTSPTLIVGSGVTSGQNGVLQAYEQLVTEVPTLAGFDYLTTTEGPGTLQGMLTQIRTRDYDATNQTVLDVLNLYVLHDIRDRGGRWMSHWLQQVQQFEGDPEPETLAHTIFQLVEFDPQAPFNLDQLMVMDYTGTLWTAIPDPDYYVSSAGLVLSADQVLRDVGEWRQLRSQALNRWEATGDFQRVSGPNVASVRRSWPMADGEGANTRSIASPCWDRNDLVGIGDAAGALEVLDSLRGEMSQVQSGFGFEQFTIVWDQLIAEQSAAWWAHLWPINYRQAYARPLAITDIPDDWRLAPGPIVFGRMMGMTFELRKGQIYGHVSMRSVPVSTQLGLTFDEAAAETTPPTWTFANTDPGLTLDLLSITSAS